jgi:hypothetical protein
VMGDEPAGHPCAGAPTSSPMPLGFQCAIFMEMVDFIEEKPGIRPLGKGGIESLREDATPALIPAFSPACPAGRPGEKGNRRPGGWMIGCLGRSEG